MCFAPQRRALFRHLNVKKWSKQVLFLPFWLGNVLRATTACTFSTAELPKVVRTWRVLYILTWKCASRHNGVQFFISHLASWLRTRRFSEVTFHPPEPQIIGKTQWIATFLPFRAPASSLFWLSPSLICSLLDFSPWLFPPLLFHLCILSEVWLLNFLRLLLYTFLLHTWLAPSIYISFLVSGLSVSNCLLISCPFPTATFPGKNMQSISILSFCF